VPRTHTITTGDGRDLTFLEAGAPDGALVVAHHGSPAAGRLFRTEVESAERLRLRLVAYDRPGYGGSAPHPGRSVADAARDVAAILAELGAPSFATYGVSGGGPHALACAALLPGRCVAAASVAGVGPADAPDLDWLEGMGEGNIEEFGIARQGREPLTEFCEAAAEQLLAGGPEGLADGMRPHLSDVDAEALTGELAEFLFEVIEAGLGQRVDGWVDDDLAFLAPWGFDLDAISVPVLVCQGRHDLMVPPRHADWLAEHLPGAERRILPDEGHLTLGFLRVDQVHAWLAERLAGD
jgi:pimeloyl-ACP methyl ester carboxylesterase